MFQVREDLCLGCGLCAQHCPQRAIDTSRMQAQIDHNRCNSCGVCLKICPQAAIIEVIAVSSQVLIEEIHSLTQQADAILARINKLSSASPTN